MFTIWTVLPVSFVTRGKNGSLKSTIKRKEMASSFYTRSVGFFFFFFYIGIVNIKGQTNNYQRNVGT